MERNIRVNPIGCKLSVLQATSWTRHQGHNGELVDHSSLLTGDWQNRGSGAHILREPPPTFSKRMFPPIDEDLRGKHQFGDRPKS